MPEIEISVEKVTLETNVHQMILLDVSLNFCGITIKNIEVSLKNPAEKNEILWFDIEFPYTWNPMVSEEFYALSFSSELKNKILDVIRKWVISQKFIYNFLIQGWEEPNNLPKIPS